MRWLVLLAVSACSSTHATGPTGGPTAGATAGDAPPVVEHATSCDEVRPRVEAMYRAEAQAREPQRVEEATADNTTMVMNDCARDPAKAVPCLAKVGTIAELEQQCLIPLDDEGTEGERFAR